MEKCLLVVIEMKAKNHSWPRQDVVQELEELVKTANGSTIEKVFCLRDVPTPNLFIGKGKAEEIASLAQAADIDTVIFSEDLSGTQQRNLEEVINKKTIDRTQLILDIFSRHAHSPEGNIQVELAQLEYLLPRLVGKGIILSRLGAGIGTRGPGEQKLEVDRRRISKRIFKLKQDLKQLVMQRQLQRKKRKAEDLFSAALIGYTNAGKSTLLNALTAASQKVANSLFTTLDSLSRSLKLPSGGNLIISDTVGFLNQLPHHLIEAFKASLEEVQNADFLIHVLDVSHPRIQEHNRAVLEVLEQLENQNRPRIIVLNKIDLLEDNAWLSWLKEKFPDSVCISAKTGENLGQLVEKIEGLLSHRMKQAILLIPLERMEVVDYIHRKAKVIKAEYSTDNVKLEVNIPINLLPNILKYNDIKIID